MSMVSLYDNAKVSKIIYLVHEVNKNYGLLTLICNNAFRRAVFHPFGAAYYTTAKVYGKYSKI